MKIHRLERRQRLDISVKKAWDFFSDPRNLPDITPKSLGLKITSNTPVKIYPGSILTYTVSPFFSIPVSWVTEITHVVEPHLFVDEQRFGPYRFWHHAHLFHETDGGVEMDDIVHYAIGFGIAGDFINKLIVKGELNRIFDYRRAALESLFGGQPQD
ncbi:MAG: SRPBCC family protein [Deltaproteobacteria bacterium]